MRIIQDIKKIIERDKGASSETETKNLNTTNDSMERPNDSDANTATTSAEEILTMEIEKTEEEREKRNDDGVQCDNGVQQEMEEKNDAESSDTNESMEGKNNSDGNKSTTKKVQDAAAKLTEEVDTMLEKADTMHKETERNSESVSMQDEVQQETEEKNDDEAKYDSSNGWDSILEQGKENTCMLKLILQHLETEVGKWKKVDTGETDPSTGSKQTDYQHQQEPTNTEKGPTLMTECKANKGTQRVKMEINHTMRQKQKVFTRPIIYDVKNATCRRKKKCKGLPIKTKQTVTKRNGRNKDKVAGFIVETSGTKTYKFVKIKD